MSKSISEGSGLRFKDTEAAMDFTPLTPEQKRRAQVTVCDMLGDATLAREALEVLGLLP